MSWRHRLGRSRLRAEPAGTPRLFRSSTVGAFTWSLYVLASLGDQNTRGMSLKWWLRPSQQDHPFFLLTIYFLFWKVLLIGIALTSPGCGYDTSTTLLPLNPEDSQQDFQADGDSSKWWIKFVRWDAIYFTQISLRGYLFEQEWAFGWGYTKLLSIFMQGTTGGFFKLNF